MNGPDDFLVPGGEGIEGPGEKGHGPWLREAERRSAHLAGDDQTVQVIQHGGVVIEGERVPGRLMQQAQQLLAGADQAIPADFLGDGGISKHAPAQDGQGGLMDQAS